MCVGRRSGRRCSHRIPKGDPHTDGTYHSDGAPSDGLSADGVNIGGDGVGDIPALDGDVFSGADGHTPNGSPQGADGNTPELDGSPELADGAP